MTRILVVDDDPLFLAIMSRSLEKAHYDVVTATEAASAIELFGKLECDGLVCPLVLPKAGLSLIREARHQSASVAIVALTGGRPNGNGAVHDDVLKMAEAVGADVVVKKPFEIHDFLATVEAAIAARSGKAAVSAAS